MENPLSKRILQSPDWDTHREQIVAAVEGQLRTSEHAMSPQEFQLYADCVDSYLGFRFGKTTLRGLFQQYEKALCNQPSTDFMASLHKQEYIKFVEQTVDESVKVVMGDIERIPIIDQRVPRDPALYDAVRRQSQDEIRGIMQENGLRSSNGEPALMDLMNTYVGYRTDLHSRDEVYGKELTVREVFRGEAGDELIYKVKAAAEEMIENYQSQKGRKHQLADKLPRTAVSPDQRRAIGMKIMQVLHTPENSGALLGAAGIKPKHGQWFDDKGDTEFNNPDLQRRVLDHQADIYLRYRVGVMGIHKQEVFEMHDFLKREYRDKAEDIIHVLEAQVDHSINQVLGQRATRQASR